MANNVVLTEFRGDASSFINAVGQMQQAINNLNTAIGNVNNANQQLTQTTNNVGATQQKVSASTIAFGNILANFAMRALSWGKQMASSFMETGVEVRKLQMVMGGSAEDMSKLLAVFGAFKIPFDALIVSYGTLSLQAVSNTKAFRNLGLSLKDVQGNVKPAIQLFGEAADAVNKLNVGTERTAAMKELFGRRFKELLPVLALGSEGMKKVAENAKRLGIVLDEQGVKKAVQFTQSQTQMHQAMQGFSFTIMQNVVPALTSLTRNMILLVTGFSNFLRQHSSVITALKVLTVLFVGLWVAVKTFTTYQALSNALSVISTGYAAARAAGLGVLASAYGAVAVAAGAAADAELAAEAFSIVGIGAAVAAVAALGGLLYLVHRMMKNTQLDLPAFNAPDAGSQDYTMTTGAGADKKANPALERAKKHLDAVKKFWDAQVKAAKDALDVAKTQAKKYEDYVKQISDGIKKAAEIPEMIGESFAKYLGPSNLVRLFTQKVADAKEFLADLKALKAANLSPTILAQLAAQGPEAGLESARVLMSDMSVIGQLNDLQAQLTDIAGQTGSMVGQYVMPEQYQASLAVPGLEQKLAMTERLGAAEVQAAQRTVNNLTVNVNSSTNADPKRTAAEVAWAAVTASTHLPSGKYIPMEQDRSKAPDTMRKGIKTEFDGHHSSDSRSGWTL